MASVISADRVNAILAAATQSEWDRNFLGTGQIATWVKAEIATAPFDPTKKSLLEYVKERMALAETLKKNAALASAKTTPATVPIPSSTQQQQQQQQPRSQPSPQRLSQNGNGHVRPIAAFNGQTEQTYAANEVDAEGSSDGSEEDAAPLEFDMDEYIQPSAMNGNGLPASRSVSPLPLLPTQQSYPHQQQRPVGTPYPTLSGDGSIWPAHSQQQAGPSQPHSYPQPSQQPQYSTQPSLDPGYLNPAMLNYSQQVQPQQSFFSQQGSSISPQQLNQAAVQQVNGTQQAARTIYSPQQLQQGRQSQPNKRPRGQEVEVEILVQPRVGSPRNSPAPASQQGTAKKQKTASAVGRLPLVASTSNPPQSKKSSKNQSLNQQGSSVASTSSIPSASLTSGQTDPQQLRTESEEHWKQNQKEIERALSLANNSPNKTVRKLFDRLGVYVTEPEGASTRGERDASVTELSVPPEGRALILESIKEETLEDFDTVFVVDPRATVLIADWVKDLALIAKGKPTRNAAMDQTAIKKTGRVTLEVLRKLPITLEVLTSLRAVGTHVNTISRSTVFDEVTKDIAGQLVKKWTRMSQRNDGSETASSKKRADTPVSSKEEEGERKKRRVSPALSTASSRSTASTSNTPTPVLQQGKPIPVRKPVTSSAGTSGGSAAATKPAPPSSSATGRPATVAGTGIKTVPGRTLPAFARRKPAPAARPVAKPAPPAPPAPPAAPAPFDPFAMSMQDMIKDKEAANNGMSIGAQLTMLKDAMGAASGATSTVPRPGNKAKKSVRWESDANLTKIKFVEVLVYGDEFGNEISSSDYFNTEGESIGGGEAEGAAMHSLSEEVEWEAPPFVDPCLTPEQLETIAVYPHEELIGSEKPERTAQEEREATVLAVSYLEDADIPDTPSESAALASLSESALPDESGVTRMTLSYDLKRNDSVQLAIAKAHLQPYDNPGYTRGGPPSYSASPNPALIPVNGSGLPAHSQAGLVQSGTAPVIPGTADLSALLARLSEGGFSNPPQQQPSSQQIPVQSYQSQYPAWR